MKKYLSIVSVVIILVIIIISTTKNLSPQQSVAETPTTQNGTESLTSKSEAGDVEEEQESADETIEGGKTLEFEEIDYTVPPIFETQVEAAIEKVNSEVDSSVENTATEATGSARTNETDIESFFFITDVHWAGNKKHSPALIKAMMEATPVKTVIFGGDVIPYSNPTKDGAIAEINSFLDAILDIPTVEFFSVFGNHDHNGIGGADESVQLSKEEQFKVLYASFAAKPNVHWIWEEMPSILEDSVVKNDYYLDHDSTRTRYLCLDWNNPLKDARADWVQNVLAKDDGYRVIVIYHGCYSGKGGVLTPEHIGIMDLIEPYKDKVVAVFSGHAHMDAVVDYYEDGSVPIIITACDTFREDYMEEGTIDEQCFDVVVVDYNESRIRLTRIGRGEDREVSFSISVDGDND